MGRAKSYAERLFDFPEVGGALPPDAARVAIDKPVRDQAAMIDADALEQIVSETQGYPYFLQEWGKPAWEAAAMSPISLADVRSASVTAIAALDESFFRARFDRLTPAERNTFGRWRNWAPDRIAPEMWQNNWPARRRPPVPRETSSSPKG